LSGLAIDQPLLDSLSAMLARLQALMAEAITT
jgi:hypothetical protein